MWHIKKYLFIPLFSTAFWRCSLRLLVSYQLYLSVYFNGGSWIINRPSRLQFCMHELNLFSFWFWTRGWCLWRWTWICVDYLWNWTCVNRHCRMYSIVVEYELLGFFTGMKQTWKYIINIVSVINCTAKNKNRRRLFIACNANHTLQLILYYTLQLILYLKVCKSYF